MCFKLGMCFGGGDDYCRAASETYDRPELTAVPNASYKGYRPTTAAYAMAADETGRKASNDDPRKDSVFVVAATTTTRGVYGGGYAPADEPSHKPPAAAARNSKVADDTEVKHPAAAAAAIPRYSNRVY
ncbi:uncharacterized protein LOC121053299 [Oryza brachyantha]|uniref:uncharacterized protein LOC121053299 n=1 Tax=Oryza brachyantha TaxID=4533 RepID=UPI0003EA80EB|nr:uncharacterized protein LOC121053299 [Oryza brachyantha]